MSNVYVCSDLHIGHKNIPRFRCKELGFFRDFKDELEHREWLYSEINKLVSKRDTLICLGDIAFSEEALDSFHNNVRCVKILVGGNHDAILTPMNASKYCKVYSKIYGLYKRRNVWLSHAPIHPSELRGKVNLYGHTHYATLDDKRYFYCCVENMIKVFDRPLALWDDVVSKAEGGDL